MAIDLTGRFPTVPLLLHRPTGPTSTANGATEPASEQNRGRPAEAELISEAPEEEAGRRRANTQSQQVVGQVPATPNPNAPRGSIIDIEV
jgi:hypothetical protein